MKLNERSVVHYATCGVPPDKSGFLMKKSERSGTFHRRWCVLKANLLFLYEERGRREPLGLVVLEGCTVELCESERVDFAFAIRFGQSHTHTLAADTQDEMEDWAKALARASFQYLRLVVRELEKQLEEAQKRPENGAAGEGGESPALCPNPPCKENGIPWNEPLKPEDLGIPERENSVSWNKLSVPNGVAWEAECGSRGRPPPVPPRRRSPPEVGVAHGEIGVCPGTTCFSKLHDWYGKEVAQIRKEWLQSQ
ncbi:Sesquipedalian-1 [Bagarius yarrelli]|uniref:Sesquipedalian n=1 Tax=Bagarius yarrelli TaxID=175774 RepID=A0A556UFV8_BAGYA|nr:Sesquipedalian-1 [Bagarius yarrelli]